MFSLGLKRKKYFRITIVLWLAVLASGNNVMRYERTAVNDVSQQMHNQHRHRHHHHRHHHHGSYHQLQQQTDVLQSTAVDRFYGESSGQRDSAFVRLSQSAESHEIHHQRAVTKVNETSASFETAAMSSRTTKTADVQASSRHSAARHLEVSERRVVNGFRPISSPKPVVLAANRQQVEVPFVHVTANASAPSEVRMQPQQRPAIAVIQLSSSAVDDKIVYHEPPNGRKRQEIIGNNVASPPPPPPSPTSKRQTPDVLRNGHAQVPAVLPHRADMQAVVNRLSAGDSWKRRKANKLAKRRTAAEELQRCRQTWRDVT